MEMLPKINRITVDLDISNLKDDVFKLVKNYIYAVRKYGKDRVHVFLTSSKRGFRIHIETEVDILTNLIERAIMDDDPYRIVFSLKRYGMSGNPEELDVSFYAKKYLRLGKTGEVEKINMEDIIGKDLIEKLTDVYGTKEFEELLKQNFDKIVDNIKKIIKPQKVLYISIDSKYLDEIYDFLKERLVRFRVFSDIYTEGNVIIRIVGSESLIEEVLSRFSDKIYKYKILEEISKL